MYTAGYQTSTPDPTVVFIHGGRFCGILVTPFFFCGHLQEKLDRFKKQQERCRTTLTGIAASKSTPKFTPPPPSSIARPPPPATRQALTPLQINEACYVDINSNKAVFDSLRNNLKVHYDGRRFSYKSKHDLKDKNQLLYLIRKFPEGIAVIDLKDSYPNVMEDLP
ncbi:hypothetical protein SDJN03_05788, partial [Cucurbita argyrosperma subsp. sororia]